MTRVLVPLGPHGASARVLPVAAALARASDASLEAVVVVPPGEAEAPAVEGAWEDARRGGVELDATLVRHDDDVLSALVEESRRGPTLLCMATHARGAVEDEAIRSLSFAVARRSLEPLVLVGPEVPGDRPTRLDGVVACVDERAPATGVLVAALPWARSLGGIHVVEVVDPPDTGGEGEGWTSAPVAAAFAGEGLHTEWDVLRGRDPAQAILAAVRRCGHPLVVMGAQGVEGGRPHLGHVTSAVVRAAPSPVLLVPPR